MKLNEILSYEENINQLFHCTTMKVAISILKSGIFKLVRIPKSNPPRYVMSTATSMKSSFMDLMHGAGQVIFVLNKPIFQQHYEIQPYVDQNARIELGNNFDEMEEQIINSKSILQIPTPFNKSIIKIVLYDGKIKYLGGSAYYTQQTLKQFKQMCNSVAIPLDIKPFINY